MESKTMERTEAEKAPDTVMASWDGCPSPFAAAQGVRVTTKQPRAIIRNFSNNPEWGRSVGLQSVPNVPSKSVFITANGVEKL